MTRRFLMAALLGCLTVATAAAQGLDGSGALVCTTNEVVDCAEVEGCEFVSPGMVNLPRFLVVDLDKRELRGDGRTTAINTLETGNGLMILQGLQAGRAWSMALSTETGALTGTVAADGFGFVVFGACTTLENLQP